MADTPDLDRELRELMADVSELHQALGAEGGPLTPIAAVPEAPAEPTPMPRTEGESRRIGAPSRVRPRGPWAELRRISLRPPADPGSGALGHLPPIPLHGAPAAPLLTVPVQPVLDIEPELATMIAEPPAPNVEPPPATAEPPPAKPPVKPTGARQHPRRHYIINLISAAALCLAGVVSALIVGTALTGHKFEQVVSPSMTPLIPVGSLVVGEKVPSDQLRVGDIIMFPRPNNPALTNQPPETIIHRIVQITKPGDGNVQIVTKGDNNGNSDCFAGFPNCQLKRDTGALADRVIVIYPGLGDVAQKAQLAAIVLIPLVLIYWVGSWGVGEIRKAWRS